MFFVAMTFFSCNALSTTSLKCASMNNQDSRARPKIINVNSHEPLFYPYSIKVNNSGVVVMISMTHMQNYVFLTLLMI